MPVSQNIISSAAVNNLGPNIPSFYSLSQLVMRSVEPQQSANTGDSLINGDYYPEAFPRYGFSGGVTPTIHIGKGVASFWNSLSGSVN